MAGWYRFLARSDHWAVRTARQGYRAVTNFSVPAPRFFFRPALALVLVVRSTYYFLVRVFYCEPLFKAYCKSYGRNLHTGTFLHWVKGEGDLMVGMMSPSTGNAISFLPLATPAARRWPSAMERASDTTARS